MRDGVVDNSFLDASGDDLGMPLTAADSAFRALVEAMPDGAAILSPTGRVAYANHAMATLLGLGNHSLVGLLMADAVGAASQTPLAAALERARAGEPGARAEVQVARDDGTTVTLQLDLGAMTVAGEAATCLVAADLTERHRVEARLRSLALTDELTGLYNARGFFALAEQTSKVAHRAGATVIVAFADLDGLRAINEQFGHREGSRALMDTAVILRQTCRDADLIARIGGDEFAVLGMVGKPDDKERLLERIREQLEIHNRDAGRAYRLSVSVGVVTGSPEPPFNVQELLHRADMAMYDVKRGRADRHAVAAEPATGAGRGAAG